MMEIDDDELLATLANGGTIDFSVWPALLQRIVSRIDHTVRNVFPIPNLPPTPPVLLSSNADKSPIADPESDVTDSFLQPLPSSPGGSASSSQEANKENNPATPQEASDLPDPPSSAAPAAPLPPSTPLPPGTLPAAVDRMLADIISTLETTFPTYPPHTIQRLAELVLTPQYHYRSLPTYLHALDRVVHVTSGLDVYPLPPAVPDISSTSLLSNGITDALGAPSPFATPGSDEALGGALLTLIPWLQPAQQSHGASSPHSPNSSGLSDSPGSNSGNGGNDMEGHVRTESTEKIEGPNGVGSVETVSVSVNGIPSMGARSVGVTQGEILRQEQRAGVVPINQLPSAGHHPVRHANVHVATSTLRNSSDSPASSATLEGDEGERVLDDSDSSSAGSAPTAEDEKPHHRGPGDIGAEDMGPQPSGPGSASANLAGGSSNPPERHEINIEAAVGRKASSPAKDEADQDVKGEESTEADKMDVEEEAPKPTTPKREADEDLEGTSKKLKEDNEEPKAADGEEAAPKGADSKDQE